MFKKYINYALAVFILIVIYLHKKNDLNEINYTINFNKNLYFFLIFKSISLLLVAKRWQLICNENNFRLNFFNSFGQINIGHLISFFTPGPFAQDVIKFYFLGKLNDFKNKRKILGISIFDRFVGLTGFILLNGSIIIFWILYYYSETILYKFENNLIIILLSFFLISFLIFLITIIYKKVLKKLNFFETLIDLFFKVFLFSLASHFANLVATIFLVSEISNLKVVQNILVVAVSLFGNFFPFTPSGLGITELFFQETLYMFKSAEGFEIGVNLRIVSFILILFLSIITCVMYIFKLFKNEKN